MTSTPAAGPVHISISVSKVVALLGSLIALLTGAHVLVMGARYSGGPRSYTLEMAFDVFRESSVPTWYATSTLLICALLLGAAGAAGRAVRDPFAWHWLGLALVFTWLSLDEAAMIHERIQELLRRGVDEGTSLFSYLSIAFTSTVALVVLVGSLRFLLSLPRRTRALFVSAGGIFVSGAIGVDLAGEFHKNLHGLANMTHVLINGVEELLEMVGVALFIYALLDYLASRFGTIALAVKR